ncbi:alpha/beta hydrolase [Mycobacterium sp. NPDC048908]|uniref:alpha/beta hydrolase n=1 Tax=Mycobacterium sp. NPDC048908 TaxID=3364292 RepID=UPI00372086A7
MTRPTISQADAWQPDSLRRLADDWDEAARWLTAHLDTVVTDIRGSYDVWTGAAAEASRDQASAIATAADAAARCLVLAAVAARDGADQIESAQTSVRSALADAHASGFDVADDGTVSIRAGPPPLLVALSGGARTVAHDLLTMRADALTTQITDALDRLGAADADAVADIDDAFAAAPVSRPAATVPSGAWPVQASDVVAGWPAMSQDRIGEQIAAMTAAQRQQLITEFPHQVGNTDGVPWQMRVAANRTNIAQAIVDGFDGPSSQSRTALYRSLVGEIDDPAGAGHRIDRQILAFDPGRASLVELNGDLSTAKSVAVMVPGLNTTIESSAANTRTARRFVSATRGDIAAITYLGGPFPHGNLVAGPVAAADPRYALSMAPRLVAFSEDVDRTVDATGRSIPVTYIGHSYGGSIVGTAEALGLTADRTLYVAAAGAGVGVDEPGDWHNRNPDVLRFSMTAPGDIIETVQGIPCGPHGADPDEMPGVIRLSTGHYDDGRLMAGPRAHSDVLNWPSDAWRNILAVITGDSETLHQTG